MVGWEGLDGRWVGLGGWGEFSTAPQHFVNQHCCTVVRCSYVL